MGCEFLAMIQFEWNSISNFDNNHAYLVGYQEDEQRIHDTPREQVQ